MKVTEFGKFSRKLRIENDELLRDMANKLGVTASYLSAEEIYQKNGKILLLTLISLIIVKPWN